MNINQGHKALLIELLEHYNKPDCGAYIYPYNGSLDTLTDLVLGWLVYVQPNSTADTAEVYLHPQGRELAKKLKAERDKAKAQEIDATIARNQAVRCAAHALHMLTTHAYCDEEKATKAKKSLEAALDYVDCLLETEE